MFRCIQVLLVVVDFLQDQWKRKKQTPEQKRAAKMAKLDPDNWKSAKDVMDERAAAVVSKRKREMDGEVSDLEDVELEKPKILQEEENPKVKKRKIDALYGQSPVKASVEKTVATTEDDEERRRRKAEQKAAKKEKKQAQKEKAKEKLERQKARKAESKAQKNSGSDSRHEKSVDMGQDKSDEDEDIVDAVQLNDIPLDVLAAPQSMKVDSSASSEATGSLRIFSPNPESGASSISSMPPSTNEAPLEPPKNIKPFTNEARPNSNAVTHTPRERLEAALGQFRASRKADGAEDKPRNRQELLDQRRRKEEERKAAKKEQRRKEKEAEARLQEEEIARRFSPGGSGSLLASPRSPMVEGPNNNFSFGRIAFDDGTQVDPSLSGVVEQHKKKGPSDAAGQLKAAQNKAARIAGLDEEKRLNIQQKDMWLNAKKKAHGEKVRDDTSLLKKALKRQEGQKKKSEKEWTERKEGVQKSQYERQKKRTDNLQKRKDEKGTKGKQAGKVKRPGFEGSFRGRSGGGKKK